MINFEKQTQNQKTESDHLDSELHTDLMNIKQLSAYNYFTGSREHALIDTPIDDEKQFVSGVREKEKQAFLEEKTRNPNLSYPKLEKLNAKQKEAELLTLKEKIKSFESDPVIQKIYLWKINEKIAENRMLQAAQDGDDKKFTRYSVFINGAPDKEIFNYTLSSLLQKNEIALHNTDDVLVKAAAQRLKDEFAHTEEVFNQVKLKIGSDSQSLDLRHENKKFTIPDEIKEREDTRNDPEYSDEEIRTIFSSYLQKIGLDNWTVVIDDTRTAISIGKNKILIPKDRKLKETDLHGLIAHEIGVHALRKESGLKTKLKILSTGLDRSKDDEGIAMYEQQKITGMSDFAGFNGYLAISLALGMDGKKRDFRSVYEILVDYYVVSGKSFKGAQKTAWNGTIRTFRGTTGKTPGACFTKDLFYRENNIGVWNLVNQSSKEVRRFSIGKYDPTNLRHIWILDQLDITEEDLDYLKK